MSETKAVHVRDVSEIRGATKKIVVKTSWMRVALVKTKIDPEDTPKEQDHLKGQAQREMLDNSSLSHLD